VFSRSTSDGVAVAGLLTPVMPVRNTVAKSVRGRLVGASAAGLPDKTITSSFTSGLPKRETCTQAPPAFSEVWWPETSSKGDGACRQIRVDPATGFRNSRILFNWPCATGRWAGGAVDWLPIPSLLFN